jgi:hypothetical protein
LDSPRERSGAAGFTRCLRDHDRRHDLVNNPGWGTFIRPCGAAWHGWTPTDLIFPFFLFIVGAAISGLGRQAGEPVPAWLLGDPRPER